MSNRKKTALRKVDQHLHSLATEHLHPHKLNIRKGLDGLAAHLKSLGPVEMSRLGGDRRELEKTASSFFQHHAPGLGVQLRDDPAAKQRQQVEVAKDLASAESVGQVGVR